MAFKLRSQNSSPLKQGPGDGSPVNVMLNTNASTQEKSVGAGLSVNKGPLSAHAETNLSAVNPSSFGGGLGYNSKRVNAGVDYSKQLGGQGNINAHATFKLN